MQSNEERTVIVDRDDQVIGAKPRVEWDTQDIHRVSALWLTNTRGEVLLAKRSMTKRHFPGCWSTAVAGTVEEGEDYLQNIQKEAQEEIGLVLPADAFVPLEKYYFEEGADNKFFIQWYHAVSDAPVEAFTPEPGEVDALRWVTKEQFHKEIKETPDLFTVALRRQMPSIAL